MASSHSQSRYRVMILGDHGVGKRSLFHRIATGRFIDSNKRPRGINEYQDLMVQNIDGEEISVTLNVDVRFEELENRAYSTCNTLLLVFSCKEMSTLMKLPRCHDDLKDMSRHPDDILWIMVANKVDLECEVPTEAIRAMATEMEVEEQNIYYVSAKTGEGVKEMFEDIVKKTHKRALKHRHDKIILKEETRSSISNKKCF